MTYKEGVKKRHLIFRTLNGETAFQHIRNNINTQTANPQTAMYFSTNKAQHPIFFETFFEVTEKIVILRGIEHGWTKALNFVI